MMVFVPFPGDFFSMVDMAMYFARIFHVFVPFPGDFFSMPFTEGVIDELNKGFRPLSRGLFFNLKRKAAW